MSEEAYMLLYRGVVAMTYVQTSTTLKPTFAGITIEVLHGPFEGFILV